MALPPAMAVKMFNEEIMELLEFGRENVAKFKKLEDLDDDPLGKLEDVQALAKLALLMNKRLIMTKYARFVYIYAKAIKERNIDFFLKKTDYMDQIKNAAKEVNQKVDESEVDGLISVIKNMILDGDVPDEIKDEIFDKLNVINDLCSQALKLRKNKTDGCFEVKFNDRDVWTK